MSFRLANITGLPHICLVIVSIKTYDLAPGPEDVGGMVALRSFFCLLVFKGVLEQDALANGYKAFNLEALPWQLSSC